MTNARDNVLMTLLNCGEWDLELLDNVGYDWDDILQFRDGCDWPASIDSVMQYVVAYGLRELDAAIQNRINTLRSSMEQGGLSGKKKKELDALRQLDPDDDIGRYFNCVLDTHVWFANHGDVYRTYLPAALDAFADGTGLEIEA